MRQCTSGRRRLGIPISRTASRIELKFSGDNTRAISAQHVMEIYEGCGLHGGARAVIEGTSHALMVSHPGEVASLIEDAASAK